MEVLELLRVLRQLSGPGARLLAAVNEYADRMYEVDPGEREELAEECLAAAAE